MNTSQVLQSTVRISCRIPDDRKAVL
jgi:hypothetical protein